ncbi:probable inactive tRNA-specific adenosine deaminase-like protein 3 isoform X1 [Helicoverpa armigera]|uniref:probable inactive tRNA-specific adenosine deaminase-like protein 3 isoform X1 n=1 Tax=Helicoverpa armigera TaxID=29058 RepID=UPI003083E6BC
MSETTEPPLKKPKMAETVDSFIQNIICSTNDIHAVVSNDFSYPIAFTKVYVGQVRNVKELSKIITILNEKLPLKELQHLKRARKKEVLLCPVRYLNVATQQSIQEYIEEKVNELRDSFEYFKVMGLPSLPPKLKWQHTEYTKIWSCNFHPNDYLERLCGKGFFNSEELTKHRCYMGVAFEVARYYLSKTKTPLDVSDLTLSNINATVVVDPLLNLVVTVAFDNRECHPVQHSAMLAIDNVAKTQNGGAWNTDNIEYVTSGAIDKSLFLYLKSKFPDVKFGARNYVSKEVLDENKMSASESPYLCTGYYIYMIREPCFMCAMGLVHARANRVFFSLNNETQGALCSKTKLHCVPSLNHHFEVFTEFL